MTEKTASNKNFLIRAIDKLYGGLNMSWRNVVLFALGTAVLTTIFLVVPIFKNTSFIRMGVTFESWIFFAVIIMANCYQQEDTTGASFFDKIRQPLLCAAKVFVFFLISQPLIYLFQVPFSYMGWKLFGYYPYWFNWTLATIPMSFIGWYINKKNWLSLIILFPILCELTLTYIGSFEFTFKHFPIQLVTGVFCLAQVLVYLWVFTPKLVQRLLGFCLPLLFFVVFSLLSSPFELNGDNFLPNDVELSENAVVEVADADYVEITIVRYGKDPQIHLHSKAYIDDSRFTITDGDNVYRYSLMIYEDDGGHPQVKITLLDETTAPTEKAADDTPSAE